MSIKKLDNLTRRLNRAMRSTLLNSDPDEVADLGKRQVIDTDTWESIGRLLRTDVSLHPNYTERVENHKEDTYFMDKAPYCLAIRNDKEYHDLFSNSGSDEAYMAHVVDGDCLCWHGDIECGATKEERKDILNFRKGFTQDWWGKNS